MAGKEATEYEVQGHKLICPICQGSRLWTRRTLINTRVQTFFDFDCANRRATNFVCEHRGYILCFLPR